MKIECPSCAAKYSIGDDKVQDRLAKIRCRKCGTTIVIDGKHNPPNIYAADASSAAGELTATPSAAPAPNAAATSSSEFTIDFGDGDQRNLTLAQVVNGYNKGEITAEHYVWAEGFDDWRALGEVEQIVEALHASARNPALATPAAAAPRAAAIGGRGTDLFGGIDQAGSEEDVTTSAASPDIMPAAPAATGARNESSVLFSLSALTSAAAKPSGGGFDGLATSSSSSSKEDSGLIDLKALTAAAAASERREQAAPMPMGLGLTPAPLGGVSAPLGLAPPLGGHSTSAAMAFDPGPMPQQKNRTGLYIAAGIVIAAVAVALIVVTSKEEPAPMPSATPIAAPAPTPTPTPAPTPTPTAESTAQPPATGAASEEDAAAAEKKAPVAARSTWRPKKSTTTTSTSQTSTKSSDGGAAAAKPKKKPATSSCGCAPGDLQCAMRCAAGG